MLEGRYLKTNTFCLWGALEQDRKGLHSRLLPHLAAIPEADHGCLRLSLIVC